MDPRHALGRLGEKHAARFLRRGGYRIVTRNYHCPMGELDMVALDGKTIVFVEVKTRGGNDRGDPEDNLAPAQQRTLTRAARYFLQVTHSQERACRFDVIAITMNGSKPARIEHVKNAFQAWG